MKKEGQTGKSNKEEGETRRKEQPGGRRDKEEGATRMKGDQESEKMQKFFKK